MIPLNVTGQGFKSFAKKQSFQFPTEAGLYFLTGDNQVEPELGANGAGKSTLWDLVCWILYGKTARGLKASDIKTWYSDEKCGGEFEFRVNETNYQLIRTWSPNTLKLAAEGEKLRTVKQDDIDELIGLDYDSFLYSILFGQFSEMFFDLEPSKKGTLFSSILKLDYWDDLSDKAKSQHGDLAGYIVDYNSFIAEYRGEIKGLEVLDFQDQLAKFDEGKAEKVAAFKEEVRNYQDDLEQLKVDGAKATKDMMGCQKEYEELKGIIPDAREIFDEIQADLTTVKRKKSKKEGEYISVEKDLKKFKSVENEGVCPYCTQEVSEEHMQNEIGKLEALLDERDAFMKACDKESSQIQETLQEASDEIHSISSDYEDAKDDYNHAKSQLQNLQREVTRITRTIRSIVDDIERAKKEENPYVKKQADVAERIKLLEEHIERYTSELEETEQKAESIKYWVKGFKEVRLFLISEVLIQLEVEVNNCLFQLGLKDWQIKFATDSENKSGALRKGFTVMIYSPYNEDPVNWKSWSGGESQRLRLAGSLGLANLILARNGVDSFIEIYDEPTQGLNDQGIQDLLETLNSRSRDLEKQLWIIDHRSLEFGGFEDSYVATKTLEGTSISKLELSL